MKTYLLSLLLGLLISSYLQADNTTLWFHEFKGQFSENFCADKSLARKCYIQDKQRCIELSNKISLECFQNQKQTIQLTPLENELKSGEDLGRCIASLFAKKYEAIASKNIACKKGVRI